MFCPIIEQTVTSDPHFKIQSLSLHLNVNLGDARCSSLSHTVNSFHIATCASPLSSPYPFSSVEHACLSSPCVNGATCVENPMGFTCVCTRDWTGHICAEGDFLATLLHTHTHSRSLKTLNSNIGLRQADNVEILKKAFLDNLLLRSCAKLNKVGEK